ncbi:MAG: hypothetical protein JJU02_01320 [Cryomorphaceae bacterium]|nr:hypothetical protein [Cryomorphaceae bacterium]
MNIQKSTDKEDFGRKGLFGVDSLFGHSDDHCSRKGNKIDQKGLESIIPLKDQNPTNYILNQLVK